MWQPELIVPLLSHHNPQATPQRRRGMVGAGRRVSWWFALLLSDKNWRNGMGAPRGLCDSAGYYPGIMFPIDLHFTFFY